MDFLAAGLGAAAGISLAAGGCAYAAMWPGSRIFGDTLIAPRRPGELALTFDDGPNPVWTPRLLDLLSEHGARATFFMVGSHAQAEAKLVKQIAEAGHLIGNHTWSHPNLALAPQKRIHEELSRTSDVLQQIIGAPVRYFRPPFGARRPAALRAAREMGMVPVMWNAMNSDWRSPRRKELHSDSQKRLSEPRAAAARRTPCSTMEGIWIAALIEGLRSRPPAYYVHVIGIRTGLLLWTLGSRSAYRGPRTASISAGWADGDKSL